MWFPNFLYELVAKDAAGGGRLERFKFAAQIQFAGPGTVASLLTEFPLTPVDRVLLLQHLSWSVARSAGVYDGETVEIFLQEADADASASSLAPIYQSTGFIGTAGPARVGDHALLSWPLAPKHRVRIFASFAVVPDERILQIGIAGWLIPRGAIQLLQSYATALV